MQAIDNFAKTLARMTAYGVIMGLMGGLLFGLLVGIFFAAASFADLQYLTLTQTLSRALQAIIFSLFFGGSHGLIYGCISGLLCGLMMGGIAVTVFDKISNIEQFKNIMRLVATVVTFWVFIAGQLWRMNLLVWGVALMIAIVMSIYASQHATQNYIQKVRHTR